MRLRLRLLAPALFLSTFTSSLVFASRPLERTEFVKRRIADMQPGLRLLDATLSEDGAHIAYAATDGTREYAVLDEQASPVADVVLTPALGRGKAPFAFITINGATVESAGIRGGVSRLFVDGKEVRKSEKGGASLNDLVVLNDTGEVVLSVFKGDRARIVMGSKESPPALGFGKMTVSRAGNRVAYGAEVTKDVWKIGVGTDFGTSTHAVTVDPVLSANGASMAYYAGDREDALTLFVEALPSRAVTYRSETAWKTASFPVFSEDGAHFVAAVSDGSKWRVIRDGKLLDGAWDAVSSVAISPSGKRAGWFAKAGETWTLYLDGKPGTKLPRPATALLVQDEHHAYVMVSETSARVVLDGRDMALPANAEVQVALGRGGALVFLARDANGWSHIEIAGRRYGPYEWLQGPWFSADGKSVSWACLDDGAFWWRAAPTNATEDPELRRVASLAKARAGDFVGAIAELDRGLALAKGDGELLGYRARAKAALGRVEEARADFDAALAANPSDPYALNGRLQLRLASGEMAGARADAEALSRVSGLATGWATLAELERDTDTKKALASADRAVALAPWWSYALTTRASIRLRRKDYKGALADTELAMKQDPRDPNGWYIRAGIHGDQKKLELACADLRTAKDMGHVDSAKLHAEACAGR